MTLLQLAISSKIGYKMDEREWVRLLLIAESKGVLYYGFEGDKVNRMALAYRIKNIEDRTDDVIPEDVEEGDILWVTNYVSASGEIVGIYKDAKSIFRRYTDINEIAFYNPTGKLIRLKRSYENEEGENKGDPATISERSEVPAGN